MTRKKFDFNKTVQVCVMKVYAVWNILMQVMSVKNDLELASILHIARLCDKSSLLYQNGSLVTLETNKCHSVDKQQLICNNRAFYLHIHFSLILRSCLVNYGGFFLVTVSKTAFFSLDAGTQLCIY